MSNRFMSSQDSQKIEASKRKHFAFRLNIFFFCVFVLFSVLIIRLAVLQFVEGSELKALKSVTYTRTIDIPPIRGNIYDRKSYPIAYSTSTQSLYYRIEPNQKPDDVIRLAYRLAEIFHKYGDEDKPQLTPAQIIDAMDVGFDIHKNEKPKREYNFSPRRIKSDLSDQEVAYILEHRDELKWIEIVEEGVRNYSDERIAVQLVGYLRKYSTAVNPDNKPSYLDFYRSEEIASKYLPMENVGFDGLEFMYQEQLRGHNGSKSYPVNALDQIIGPVSITYPTKGNNLYLTIDKDVQLKTQQAIEEHLAFMKSEEARRLGTPAMGRNATTGYAVAMEVQTGKVIAMASYPDYDPNIWAGGSITPENYENNKYYFKNGTISEAYPNYPDDVERAKHPTSLVPLGSVVKPLTILIGLEEGLIRPTDRYYDQGIFYFGRNNSASITNSNRVAYGSINAFDAIRVSSNTFMSAMIGNPLYFRDGEKGLEVWDQYMESFGLGVLTGSGLPGEIRGTKNYFDLDAAGSAQSALVYASWGQMGRYTALQLAQYAATIASKGKRMKPQFVEEIRTHTGEIVEKFEPVVLDEVHFKDEHWELVHQAMQHVGVQGFEGFPYSFARKTGTSQQDVSTGTVNNAVFIAFAPVENPTLAVAVIVPEGGYGAWGAAPIARKIFDAYDEAIGLVQEPAHVTD